MNNLRILHFALIMIVATVILSGCHRHSHRRHVPRAHQYVYVLPPHAPAHGYRHRYHDHDLVYDADIGVYRVLGFVNYYFINNVYYRYTDHGWLYSSKINRGWRDYRKDRLPGKLHNKYAYRKGGNNRGHQGYRNRRNQARHGKGKQDATYRRNQGGKGAQYGRVKRNQNPIDRGHQSDRDRRNQARHGKGKQDVMDRRNQGGKGDQYGRVKRNQNPIDRGHQSDRDKRDQARRGREKQDAMDRGNQRQRGENKHDERSDGRQNMQYKGS